jgi:hypothetical protein
MRTYFEKWKLEYDDICAGIYKWDSEAKDGSPREMTVTRSYQLILDRLSTIDQYLRL